jgi:hypothetical protein
MREPLTPATKGFVEICKGTAVLGDPARGTSGIASLLNCLAASIAAIPKTARAGKISGILLAWNEQFESAVTRLTTSMGDF